MCKNRKGFSLFELLIVISIVAVLGTVGVGFYLNYAKNVEIKTVANTLISDLKQAQAKSMAGTGGFKWGVHLVNGDADYYETFSTSSDYNGATSVSAKNYLSSGVSFSDPTTGASKDIIFNKITGGTTSSSIILSSSEVTKTISVSSVGNIINGEFVIPSAPVIKLLVVAGGGGGGTPDGGGGGAGGYIYEPSYTISKQTYTVAVGDGGSSVSGATKTQGGKGGNSSFNSILAEGGGGGGGYMFGPGGAGGSGGGAGGFDWGTTGIGGTGTQGQGQDGGSSVGGTPTFGGGGGGGAVGSGQNGGATFSGAGGVGFVNPITGSVSGHNVSGTYYFSGGGGGGSDNSTGAAEGGVGGYGGGGKGGYGIGSSFTNGVSGSPNTGGGGGGAPWGQSSGAGGSGVVIISYLTDSGIVAIGGIKTVVGAETIHTFNSSGTFEVQSVPSGETPAPDPVIVGDTYQGGIVAYILQVGNPGYDANVQHGLIAALNDQSAGIVFSVLNTVNAGTASGVGTGNTNTIAIVSAYGAENNAAKLCSDLSLGDKTDWYLPSKDELNKLYENRASVGGFSNAEYWTSTERSDYPEPYAYRQNMSSGTQSQNGDKQNNAYVRCIRSF